MCTYQNTCAATPRCCSCKSENSHEVSSPMLYIFGKARTRPDGLRAMHDFITSLCFVSCRVVWRLAGACLPACPSHQHSSPRSCRSVVRQCACRCPRRNTINCIQNRSSRLQLLHVVLFMVDDLERGGEMLTTLTLYPEV